MNDHKNILVLGATSGIGSEIAGLLSHDFNLILSGRNETKLKELSSSLGDKHILNICDLSVDADLDHLAVSCPLLDGIVYCSGVASAMPARYIRREDIRMAMEVNFEGAVLSVSRLLKQKKINADASIVFISSEAVRFPFFGSSVYSATKGALEAYALALATELQPKKIRVNCISPAYVETPMLDQARTTISADFVESMKKMHPEAFTTPDKIAGLVAFLLSNDAASVNGQIIKTGRFNINIPGI